MGNSTLDLHAACTAGTWQALVFGFLGIRFSEAGPVLDAEAVARLPQDWRTVELKLTFCGQGDAAQELSHLIERLHLLVVGWHGQFITGHAEVLKTLIGKARCAVLLVKPRPRDIFRLKVGIVLT